MRSTWSSQNDYSTAIRASTGIAGKIKIRAGDKFLYAGSSGTGKSYAKRKVIERIRRLYPTFDYYALDTGEGDDYDYLGEYRSTDDTAPREPAGPAGIQVWSPEFERPDEIERWLWMIRHNPPAVLDIDEALSLYYGGRDVSEEFSRLLKVCRKLPISIHTASQELVKVPRNIIGQVNHVFRFGLSHPYEVMLLNSMLKENVKDIPDEHGLWYRPMRGGAAKYFNAIQDFLGEES